MARAAQRTRVAVLGGGPAAIAAAFQLTAPERRGRFEVTVYQPGWRLGGKCASGRNLDADKGRRIEEHGLHVWFGFYENAFRVMRDAYRELARPPGHPLATIEQAFKGCDELILYDRQGDTWERLVLKAPRNDLAPGTQTPLPRFWDIARELCGWVLERFEQLRREKPEAFAGHPRQPRLSPGWLANAIGAIGAGAGIERAPGGENLLIAAHHLAHSRSVQLARAIPVPAHPAVASSWLLSPERVLALLLGRFRDWLWEHVIAERVHADVHLRFFFTMLDTVACAAAGIVEDGVLEKGWEAIDDEDLCQWLSRHGAAQVTVGATPATRSPLLRAIYDVAFGYPEGDIDKANVAAGTALSDLLRLAFSYRGSIMYKMQAGMGDTVLTPFYEVLCARGVSFRFFHAVTGMRLSGDGARVQEIDVVPQVELRGAHYQPLVMVDGLECWPSEPDWRQLQDGDRLKADGVDFERHVNPLARQPEALIRGEDFDAVVLGIPVGGLADVCGEIARRHAPFAAMLRAAVTVRTQAFQLWLGKAPDEMCPHDSQNSVAGCYTEPLDTWCDMTHLLAREAWRPGAGVNGIAYFCGVLDDRPGEDAAAATARVKDNAMAFLSGHVGPIWPGAVGGGGAIDWSLLHDPRASSRGSERLAAQYWRANTTPSERYVLTPAGSVKHRLAAGESGVENLVLAGDWTRTGIDGGCVEAAVLSGLQAARALTGEDRQLIGESRTWLTDRPTIRERMTSLLGLRRGPRPAAPRDGLPAYVDYGGRATTPPPFASTQGRFQGLLLEGDAERIDELCQRTLNRPAGGAVEYRPLMGPHMLLLTGSFGRISSQAPGYAGWGYIDETQVSLWIPLAAGRRVAGRFVPQRLCMSVPFIVVDNPMSYAGGREVYGYPKTLGTFDPPAGLGDPLTVKVFGGDFSSGEEAAWRVLFQIARAKGRRGAGAARSPRAGAAESPRASATPARSPRPGAASARAGKQGAGDGWLAPEQIVEHFRARAADWGLAPDLSLLADAIGSLMRREARQVFLKQFRDAALPGRACYQAIVEAPVHVTSVSWRPSLESWQVTVEECDSHPVTAETGLATQTARLTFDLKMDMIAEPGVVVAPRPR